MKTADFPRDSREISIPSANTKLAGFVTISLWRVCLGSLRNSGSAPTKWHSLSNVFTALSGSFPETGHHVCRGEHHGTDRAQTNTVPALFEQRPEVALPSLSVVKYIVPILFSIIKTIWFWFIRSIHLLREDCNSPRELNWSCSFIWKTTAVWAELEPISQITETGCSRQALRLNPSHLVLGSNVVSLAEYTAAPALARPGIASLVICSWIYHVQLPRVDGLSLAVSVSVSWEITCCSSFRSSKPQRSTGWCQRHQRVPQDVEILVLLGWAGSPSCRGPLVSSLWLCSHLCLRDRLSLPFAKRKTFKSSLNFVLVFIISSDRLICIKKQTNKQCNKVLIQFAIRKVILVWGEKLASGMSQETVVTV